MKYNRFEETPIWQVSREFVNSIYKLLSTNKILSKDFSLSDQLKRASYSVMLNIAEGTVKSRLFRAREEIKQLLRKILGEL